MEKKAISKLTNNPKRILDVATGTADFAIAATKLNKADIIGVDISENMLEIGEKKVKSKGLENRIELQLADSENLPFKNDYFDAITAGFGVRNFENLKKGLSEMWRALNKNGIVVIRAFQTKDFSNQANLWNLFSSNFYLFGYTSKDKNAYNYLPASVDAFPENEEFVAILEGCRFFQGKIYTINFWYRFFIHSAIK